VAVDGTSARGSRHDGAPAAHLPAALTGKGGSRHRSASRTSPTRSVASDLLELLDLKVVVTADALHAQRDHADFLVGEKKGHYVPTVKRNQPTLHERLRTCHGQR
jgi:hypothetical protein